MPYFSAGMPDIKILLLAVPAHILPQAVPRHTEDNCILPRNLPAIPYRFLSLEHHTFHETKNNNFLFPVQHVPRSFHKADPKTHRSAARTLWFHPEAARYFPVFLRFPESGNPSAVCWSLPVKLLSPVPDFSFFLLWKVLKMRVECAVYISFCIIIRAGDPVNMRPRRSHAPRQFQHVFSLNHNCSSNLFYL